MLRSMTGFGVAAVTQGGTAVRVEVKSVNHRHLQVKARLASEQAGVEGEIEARVRAKLERGAVTVNVSVERTSAVSVARIDVAAARAYREQIVALARELALPPDVSMDALLALPGVVAAPMDGARREQDDELVLRALDKALDELVAMRAREGAHLVADLEKNTEGVRKIVAKLEKRAPKALAEHHAALHQRVQELLDGSTSSRDKKSARLALQPADLAREIALLADRMDTSEEFIRLASHLAQLDGMLASKKPIGRQLDFLVQEFLREANTIGSKCNDAAMAHAVVELKSLIERLREQVQNVE